MANPACVAYEAWRAKFNASDDAPHYAIPWKHLPSHEKKAWFAAVAAVGKLLSGGLGGLQNDDRSIVSRIEHDATA